MAQTPEGFDRNLRSGRRWTPREAPPESQRAALHRIANAMRSATEALMDSDASVEQLNAIAERAEELDALVREAPNGRALWGYAESSNSDNPDASFDNSPVVGPANPVAPPLKLQAEGDYVRGTAYFTQQYEGPPGHVHGGIVSAAFDELLGMVQSLTGNPGMTGKLVVHYRKPTPLYRELHFEGKVDRVDGRKIYTSGTLHYGETLCAEAEAIFISVDFSRLRGIADET